MNTYQISIQRENGTTCTDRVVANTPAEAKKFFREIYRHGEGFQSKELRVELVAENIPATKDMERKALEQIKSIVESLGEDSYIATAFEGCFEIAEENIENDFACSMKQRVEAVVVENARLKEKIKELGNKLDEIEKNYEAAIEAAHLVANEKDAEIAHLKAVVLSPDDMEDVRQLLKDRLSEDEQKASQAAAEIVKYADDPASNEFKNAVRMHRAYIESVDYTKCLMDRLKKTATN
ncbi:Uncharacterised protein [uncultured Flavonifractor sp.]|nr:Uncharacterised protein [uncultured Flavonifractor sp.]